MKLSVINTVDTVVTAGSVVVTVDVVPEAVTVVVVVTGGRVMVLKTVLMLVEMKVVVTTSVM